jgi:methylsterol monooxygenase
VSRFVEEDWSNGLMLAGSLPRYIGDPVLATGIMSFLIHEFFYFVRWSSPRRKLGSQWLTIHSFVPLSQGRCIPWIFVDKIRKLTSLLLVNDGKLIPIALTAYFRKYKLQENKEAASWEEQWACTKYVLFTHFTIELPQIFLFGPVSPAVACSCLLHPLTSFAQTCDYFGLSTHHVPFPSIKAMAAQIALFFFVEDFYHCTFSALRVLFPLKSSI